MRIDNKELILLALNTIRQKSKSNSIFYRDLKESVKQNRSQISQALTKIEEEGLISKAEDRPRFDIILLTSDGIQRAEQLKAKFTKFFIQIGKEKVQEKTPERTKEKPKPKPQIESPKPKPSSSKAPQQVNEKIFNEFIEQIHDPLQEEIRSALLEEIPEEHLKASLVKNITYSVQDCIFSELVKIFLKK